MDNKNQFKDLNPWQKFILDLWLSKFNDKFNDEKKLEKTKIRKFAL